MRDYQVAAFVIFVTTGTFGLLGWLKRERPTWYYHRFQRDRKFCKHNRF